MTRLRPQNLTLGFTGHCLKIYSCSLTLLVYLYIYRQYRAWVATISLHSQIALHLCVQYEQCVLVLYDRAFVLCVYVLYNIFGLYNSTVCKETVPFPLLAAWISPCGLFRRQTGTDTAASSLHIQSISCAMEHCA